MPKTARLALATVAARHDGTTKKKRQAQTQSAQHDNSYATTAATPHCRDDMGIHLCRRWFVKGHHINPPHVVRDLDFQAHQRGLGGGRGPNIGDDDVESIAAEMLKVANRPHGT
ncbi:MAG: hypothetical protein ACKPKO_48325, partial [Candidatus Fonsibacter sp.]